jgi:hypothetical protein
MKRWGVLIAIVLASATVAWFWQRPSENVRRFHHIHAGMTRSQVEELLGESEGEANCFRTKHEKAWVFREGGQLLEIVVTFDDDDFVVNKERHYVRVGGYLW